MQHRQLTLTGLCVVAAGTVLGIPAAHADNDVNTLVPNNHRLNDGVIANVYTVQHQAGCTNDIKVNPQLQQAAQWQTHDVLNNRSLDGDIGSDGSTPQSRANAAGYQGRVAETVAINPALAINGVQIINQWYYDPAAHATMANCANTQMGVWSENSLDRTVLVAVYGQPNVPDDNHLLGPELGLPSPVLMQQNVPLDPAPDYDGSDEIQYFFNWLPWSLRWGFPPPAYPSN
jgi:hypothetical protein